MTKFFIILATMVALKQVCTIVRPRKPVLGIRIRTHLLYKLNYIFVFKYTDSFPAISHAWPKHDPESNQKARHQLFINGIRYWWIL